MFRIAFWVLSVVIPVALLVEAPSADAQIVPAAPLNRPLPGYPAAADTTEGAVKLRFRIDVDGRATDVTILEARPAGVFDAAALSAVSQWRYSPRTENGTPVEQADNNVLLKFQPPAPNEAPIVIRNAPAYYPRGAFDQGIEGDVTVKFDVSAIGMAEHASVIESTVPSVFDASALLALKTMRFGLRLVDGTAQPAMNVKMNIPFRVKDALLAPIRISQGKPAYPLSALKAGLQGFCMTHFSIREDGSTDDVELLFTYPRDVFRQSCLDFIRNLKYARPAEEPRGHVDREHSIRVEFLIGSPGSAPKNDLRAGEWVRIQYTVTSDGHVTDAKVLQTSNPDVRWRAALEQVREQHVRPIFENGVAVEKPGQIVVITGPED